MRIFLDTAEVKEIREGMAMNLCDGVTTNPSLVAKSGRKLADVAAEITEIVEGRPVSLECVREGAVEMIEEGRGYAKIRKNVVVKVPMTLEGLKACKRLSEDGIPINVTLCFSPIQALLAAKAGATYISPFIGRLDDVATEGMQLVGEILTIYRNYGFKTEVLVASVRSPMHVVHAALLGAHVATLPFAVVQQLAKHPLTDAGLAKFASDAKRT